jgi:serine protease Do
MKYLSLIASTLLLTSSVAYAEKGQICDPKAFSDMFTSVAEKAMPASVYLRVEINPADNDMFGRMDPNGSPFEDDFLKKFFGFPQGRPMQPRKEEGSGSGFIVSPDGLIMTNHHVIAGADKIEVTLHDGQVRTAKLIGSDPRTDLAVLKIEKVDNQDYPYLEFGDSEELKVAEWVLAIGSPFQLEASVTQGVISAKGRQGLNITDQEDFIQTDAAINPGNSGGPLVNLDGKVIGINTVILSRSGGFMGIGFAIPSNMARHVMDQIVNKGSVTRGFLGIELQTVDKDIAEGFNMSKAEGVLVSSVAHNSPAENAGIETGDIILELNGKAIKTRESFRNQISMMDPGSEVKLKVFRKGKPLFLTVKLGSNSDVTSTPAIFSQKLGIEVETLSGDLSRQLGYTMGEEGVVITKIKPGSPAAMAGLRPGNLIMSINHKKVANIADYEEAIGESGQNKRVTLLVKVGKSSRYVVLRLE